MNRPIATFAPLARLRALAGLLLPSALGVALLSTPAVAGRSRASLDVFAAASLTDAFRDLARVFERRHPGIGVRLNLAGSHQLAAQLDQGATADVFASADERWMTHVAERQLLAHEPTTFAANEMVVIVPKANRARIESLKDLAHGGIKVVLAADAVPAGRYSRIVLQNLSRDRAFEGDFAKRVLANVVSEEDNVRAIVGKVALGEADAGFVYRSDAAGRDGRSLRVLSIPKGANVTATFSLAVTHGAKQPDAARAFVALVLSSDGQRILARHGFGSPPPRAE